MPVMMYGLDMACEWTVIFWCRSVVKMRLSCKGNVSLRMGGQLKFTPLHLYLGVGRGSDSENGVVTLFYPFGEHAEESRLIGSNNQFVNR